MFDYWLCDKLIDLPLKELTTVVNKINKVRSIAI